MTADYIISVGDIYVPNGYELKKINGNADISFKVETRIDRIGCDYKLMIRVSGTYRVVANRDIVVPSIISENSIADKGT